MKQTIEIEVPEGKKAIWKDNNIVFEDIKHQLPKTWEEFCSQNSVKNGECYIDVQSNVLKSGWKNRDIYEDKNMFPSQKAAEQHLALIQLHQLRDCYRQGWIPDWGSYKAIKYCIEFTNNKYIIFRYYVSSNFLSFPTKELAKEFLTNFRELIEKAGDLI